MAISKGKACTGCSACANICPHSCIVMASNSEGFIYPTIDTNKCTNCNLCQKVCPLNNIQLQPCEPLSVIGCRIKSTENLLRASSGGMFELLASTFIKNGGIVVAARFNSDNNVVHEICTTLQDIKHFTRSKYVQSNLGKIFQDIKEKLKEGTKVLFVGTPCQVSGLIAFMRKPNKLLYCIDFVCHGVPSPKVWNEYLTTLGPNVSQINFRDKESGWPNYSFSFIQNGHKHIQSSSQNPYMRGFLHNLYLRLSCHECHFKGFTSKADLTLSDFWGVWKNYPQWNDQQGAGVLAINTIKGQELFNTLNKEDYEQISITVKQAFIDYNNSAYHATPYTPKREKFFSRFEKEPLIPLIIELSKDSLSVRIKNYLSKIKHHFTNKKTINYFKKQSK